MKLHGSNPRGAGSNPVGSNFNSKGRWLKVDRVSYVSPTNGHHVFRRVRCADHGQQPNTTDRPVVRTADPTKHTANARWNYMPVKHVVVGSSPTTPAFEVNYGSVAQW